MSYEGVRERLDRCKRQGDDGWSESTEILDALGELTVALEADLVQIKAALSHVAMLLEERNER